MAGIRRIAATNGIGASALLIVSTLVSVRALDASMMVNARALATTSTSCPTEGDACIADSTCIDCVEEYANYAEACASASGSPETCDDVDELICCAISGGSSCSTNDAFDDFISCVFEDVCPVDIGSCTSSAATTDDAGGATTDDAGGATTDDAGGATTDDSTSSECPTETEACAADSVCIDCIEEYTASIDGCLAASGSPGTCDEFQDVLCCAVESGVACESNDALGDFFGCVFEDICSVDFSLCSSSNGATTTTEEEDEDPTTTTGDDGAGGLFPGVEDDDDDEDTDTGLGAATSSAPRAADIVMSFGVSLSFIVTAALCVL